MYMVGSSSTGGDMSPPYTGTGLLMLGLEFL